MYNIDMFPVSPSMNINTYTHMMACRTGVNLDQSPDCNNVHSRLVQLVLESNMEAIVNSSAELCIAG